MIIYDVISLKLKDIKQSSDNFTVQLTNFCFYLMMRNRDTYSKFPYCMIVVMC